jgi:hypothetical protein
MAYTPRFGNYTKKEMPLKKEGVAKWEKSTSKSGCVIRESAMELSQALAPDRGGMPGMFKGHDKADIQESPVGGLASYATPNKAKK